MKPIRVAAVLTHPTQYFSPWFRQLHARHRDVEFNAVYAVAPDADRQGVGFGSAFQWDVPLLDGYPSQVLRPSDCGDDVHSSRFFGVDAPILPTLKRLKPDVVMVCGWHSIFQIRTLLACRRLGIPTLYRGDTTLLHEPSGFKGSLWRLKTKLLLRSGFNGWLAVGTRSREYLLRMGVREEKIFHSPHCVDNALFADSADAARRASPSPKERYGLHGKFVALFAGKLEEIKRPNDLIAAVAKLGGDWSALFVGGGPLESELKLEAARLGVTASFAGFHNQSEMGRAYAAADVFVLPSRSETWGLAVNEALACGVPCIVSDGVGCAPDLIEPGRTGETYPRGDVDALAKAMSTMRSRNPASDSIARDCRQKAATHSFEAASNGLVLGAQAVAKRIRQKESSVVAVCGTMAFAGGLERQTFQMLGVLANSGRPIHVIGNEWANWQDPSSPHPIKEMADKIGAEWSTGSYWQPFAAARRPVGFAKLVLEMMRVSHELVGVVQRSRAKTVFFPDFGTVLRNAFGLLWLRWKGVRTVLRIGNAPERTPHYEWMWRRVLPPIVDRFVANSEFVARRLRECGVPAQKIECIKNAVVVRTAVGTMEQDAAEVVARGRTVLCAGQMIPFKGPHMLLDAAELLLAKGRDFQVALLGRRPDWPDEYVRYFAEMEKKANTGLLAGRVHFLSEVDNLPHVMRSAWVLAAPIILEEAFGNVVLEAKSVGLPAVITPRGGLVELVEHQKTGYICQDVDAASFAEGLDWFLADETRRQAAARECLTATRRSDWPYARERYEAAWRSVFDEVHSEPGKDDTRKTAVGSQLRVVS